ncbi:MAG: hypothetical protein K6F50_04445 [Kiritimatiellae bacterium]|nr:hypothetical protein [Kiritimatiellia bacterium]
MLMKTAGKIVENDGERARKTVFEGLPDIAVEMHGTSAALDSLQGYLLPVANGFDALKHAAETGSADWRNLEMLRKDLDAAGKALAGAAEQGIQYPGTDSVFRPDPGLLVSLSKLLDGIRNDIAAFTAEYERASRLASIEGKCPDMSGTRLFSVFGQKIVDKIAGKGKAAEFVQCFAALRAMLVTIMISRSLSIFCNMKAAIDKIMFENRSLADDAAELSRNLRAMQRILRGEDEKDPRLAEVESKLRETIDSLAPSERDELEKELEDGKVIEAIDEIAAMNEALLEQTAKRLSDRMSVQKMH